jgi:hypothetical protein
MNARQDQCLGYEIIASEKCNTSVAAVITRQSAHVIERAHLGFNSIPGGLGSAQCNETALPFYSIKGH